MRTMREREYYKVELCGLERKLPLFEVAPGVRIAIFNILGDTEIVRAIAPELAKRLPKEVEVIITPEVKSIPLAYELSAQMGLPYVVARKTLKPYMGDAISVEVLSITTGKPQTLWLDEKDLSLLKGKRVAVVDDVISTGSTLEGVRRLMREAGAEVVAEAAVFTEGEEGKWPNVMALGNLPVFTEESS